MFTTTSTYADLLKDCVKNAYRSFQSFSSSKLIWEGSDEEAKVGILADSLLRYAGEVKGYKTVVCVVGQYQLKVHRNQLTIQCNQRRQEIFKTSYGVMTRTMSILHNEVDASDVENLKQSIKSFYKKQQVDHTEQLETMKVPQGKSNRYSAYAKFREIQQQIIQELKAEMESELKLAGCMMLQTVKKQYARAISPQPLHLQAA